MITRKWPKNQLILIISLLITFFPSHSQAISFTFNGFRSSANNLTLDGIAGVTPTGLLQLTNYTKQKTGHAFYPTPLVSVVQSTLLTMPPRRDTQREATDLHQLECRLDDITQQMAEVRLQQGQILALLQAQAMPAPRDQTRTQPTPPPTQFDHISFDDEDDKVEEVGESVIDLFGEPIFDSYLDEEEEVEDVAHELLNVHFHQVAQDSEIEEVEHIDFLGVDRFDYIAASSLLTLWNNIKDAERFARTIEFMVFRLANIHHCLCFKYLFCWSGRNQVSPHRSKNAFRKLSSWPTTSNSRTNFSNQGRMIEIRMTWS